MSTGKVGFLQHEEARGISTNSHLFFHSYESARVNWLVVWGPVVWIPGIPLWRGLFLRGTPRIQNHLAPNHPVAISWYLPIPSMYGIFICLHFPQKSTKCWLNLFLLWRVFYQPSPDPLFVQAGEETFQSGELSGFRSSCRWSLPKNLKVYIPPNSKHGWIARTWWALEKVISFLNAAINYLVSIRKIAWGVIPNGKGKTKRSGAVASVLGPIWSERPWIETAMHALSQDWPVPCATQPIPHSPASPQRRKRKRY